MLLSALCLSLLAQAPLDTWHFTDCSRRALGVVHNAGQTALRRPMAVPMPEGGEVGAWRAWDEAAGREAPAQADPERREVLVETAQPMEAGARRVVWLYAGEPTDERREAGRVRLGADWAVSAAAYEARLDPASGTLPSLKLRTPGGLVEALGDGIHWWCGREPMVKPADLCAGPPEVLAAGPLFVAVRVRYPGLVEPDNELTTTYRFFPDFLEVQYHYSCRKPTEILWFKAPVTLRATGDAPGLHSHQGSEDQPLQTAGESNTWTPDRRWHDVSYDGEQGYGIGVVMLGGLSDLWFMDSARPGEHEWVYAEPFGWQKPQAVEEDWDVALAVVPHEAGRGRYKVTPGYLRGELGCWTGQWQRRGEGLADSDGDGLADAAEVRANTNPTAADTDLDGTPDGADPEPLRGAYVPRPAYEPSFAPATGPGAVTPAQVKEVGGVPTVVVGGRRFGPETYNKCGTSWEELAELSRSGFGLQFLMVGGVGWPGKQEDVFKRLDEMIPRLLEAVPDAYLVLRCYLCAPPDFAVDYPEETMAFNDGRRDHFTQWYAMRNLPLEKRGYPSFASEVWRQGMAEALYRYVQHIRQAPYSDRVVGYFLCGGGTEEWYYWGDYDHNRYAVDYSPAMLARFRDHLRRKYQGDVEALRRGWADPSADFATALPPPPEMRRQADFGYFWDPATSQRVLDYYYVHNAAMEEAVLTFARAVKQATAGQALVGMFHGYLQNHWFLEGGQAELKRIIASPDVDFFAGPPQYDRRGPGEHGCIRAPNATLKQHGKLWFSESDIRSHFLPVQEDNPALHGRPQDLPQTLGGLKREFAHVVCEGCNGWWFPMGPGSQWYNQGPILELFARQQRLGEAAMGFERSADTDITAAIDLDSLYACPPWPVTSTLIDTFKVQELCRIGAPVDYYELSDLLRASARYKLVLVLNGFILDAEEREGLRRLAREGATVVFMYAPGLLRAGAEPSLSLDHIADATGLRLDEEHGQNGAMDMKLTEAGARLLPGFDAGRPFGSVEQPGWKPVGEGTVEYVRPEGRTSLQQRFSCAGGGEALARFVEGGQVGMAMREEGKGRYVWIGATIAPADLLRELARWAGCHLFCERDDIVYANRSFLAVHARESGGRTFRLRRPADVVDCYSGEVLARGAREFSCDVEAYDTRMFFLGDAAAWEKALAEAERTLSARTR